jgi:hypothetical protein
MDTAPTMLKIPPIGTTPSKLLKDKLRVRSLLKDVRNPGTVPDKLFSERSNSFKEVVLHLKRLK